MKAHEREGDHTNRETKEEDPASEFAEGAEGEKDEEEGPDDAAVRGGALRDAEGDLRPEEAEQRERKEVQQLADVGAEREERVLAAVRGAVRKEVASALRRRRQKEEHRANCGWGCLGRWVGVQRLLKGGRKGKTQTSRSDKEEEGIRLLDHEEGGVGDADEAHPLRGADEAEERKDAAEHEEAHDKLGRERARAAAAAAGVGAAVEEGRSERVQTVREQTGHRAAAHSLSKKTTEKK